MGSRSSPIADFLCLGRWDLSSVQERGRVSARARCDSGWGLQWLLLITVPLAGWAGDWIGWRTRCSFITQTTIRTARRWPIGDCRMVGRERFRSVRAWLMAAVTGLEADTSVLLAWATVMTGMAMKATPGTVTTEVLDRGIAGH